MGARLCRASAVIVQQVPAAAAEWFLEWQQGVTAAAEAFPGYRGTDIYPATELRDGPSVVIVHFEDEKSLEQWLSSPTRAEWVEKLRDRVGDFELHKLAEGFGPWFGELQGPDVSPTAGWKMALTVLLGLYPTVMLLSLFPGAYTASLGMAVSLLIGNVLSVSLLQWVVMPLLTTVLARWLRARPDTQPALVVAGSVLIGLVLLGLVLLFRPLTG